MVKGVRSFGEGIGRIFRRQSGVEDPTCETRAADVEALAHLLGPVKVCAQIKFGGVNGEANVMCRAEVFWRVGVK